MSARTDPRGSPAADKSPAQAESAARTIALRLLESQPRTRAELARAMARRGVPEDAATAVLDRFADVGLIDDDAFAAAWVDSRHTGRGLGRRALADELRRRGVAEDTVREAVSVVTADDERVAAQTLAERRLRTMNRLPRETQLRRLVAMLARKGFGHTVALSAARAAVEAEAGANGADPS